jgi:hypothetical protein
MLRAAATFWILLAVVAAAGLLFWLMASARRARPKRRDRAHEQSGFPDPP